MRGTRSLIKGVWLWSWLLTLSICVVGGYWASNTLKSFYDFSIRYDITPFKVSLHQIGVYEWQHMIRQLDFMVVPDYLKTRWEAESSLKTVDLLISEPAIASLNAELPHSGFDYVKGRLWNEGKLRKAKVRYRGDYSYHWMFHKKSLRVKTQKDHLYEGVRKFNLIANKFEYQLSNAPGYFLKDLLGNLGPHAEMVNVRINGRHKGVHTYVEQIDESTLRRSGFLPGDIFSGELSAKDRFEGSVPDLFRQGGMWEKVAVNNHFDEDASDSIEALVLLVGRAERASSTDDTHLRLNRMLNIDEWGKFMAFETISQTHHYDSAHNWRLYFDPGRSSFIPIIWDPVAWAWSTGKRVTVSPDLAKTRIQRALLRNAPLLAARSRHVSEFYAQNGDKKLLERIDETIDELAIASRFDPNLRPVSVEDTIVKMRSFRTAIARVLRKVKGHFDPNNCGQSYARPSPDVIRIEVAGRCEVTGISILFEGELAQLSSLELQYTRIDGSLAVFDILDRHRVEGNRLYLDMNLMAEHRFLSQKRARIEGRIIDVMPGTYDLVFKKGASGSAITAMTTNVYGRTKMIPRVEEIEVTPLSLKGIVDTHYSRTPLIWSGVKKIEGIVEIDQPLVILPGTDVQLGEQASLLISGKVTAHGTPDRPIRFRPSEDSTGPWGTVAILSERGNGSEFKHTDFMGGSGLKRKLYEYSGMFSIHSARNVLIENSTFRDNSIVDDMVHFVYAEVTINNSQFYRAHLDALDADISSIVIDNSLFSDAGNDALDLMTTESTVTNTTIEGSKDKAISVGEASTLELRQSKILNNAIGLQSKDGSLAKVVDVDFTGNQLAVDAYKKNWRYDDGGKVEIVGSRFVDNTYDLSAGKRSTVSVLDASNARPVVDRGILNGSY